MSVFFFLASSSALFLASSSSLRALSSWTFEYREGFAKLIPVCLHQCEVTGNVNIPLCLFSTDLHTLLPFLLAFAADPMLLCSLGTPFLLRDQSQYNFHNWDHSKRANGGVYCSKWQSWLIWYLSDESGTFRLVLITNEPTTLGHIFVSMGAFL